MFTRAIRNKIGEQRGASLVMALFALVVVTIVGAIILSSALSVVGRIKQSQQTEQNYLTVSSAAEYVKGGLSGLELTYEQITKNADPDADPDDTASIDVEQEPTTSANKDTPFSSDLKTWFLDDDKAFDKSYIISVDGFEDVVLRMYIDKKDAEDDRMLSVDFKLNKAQKESNYYMQMKLTGKYVDNGTSDSSETYNDGTTPKSSTVTHTMTFADPAINKGSSW